MPDIGILVILLLASESVATDEIRQRASPRRPGSVVTCAVNALRDLARCLPRRRSSQPGTPVPAAQSEPLGRPGPRMAFSSQRLYHGRV